MDQRETEKGYPTSVTTPFGLGKLKDSVMDLFEPFVLNIFTVYNMT